MGGGREPQAPERRVLALALTAALLAAPGPLPGQGTDGRAQGAPGTGAPFPGLELDAAVGLLTPLADLAPGDDAGGGVQLSSSAGVRAGGIWRVDRRLGIGVTGTWVPVDVERLPAAGPDDTPIPGGKLADADFLVASLEAVLTLPSIGSEVQVEPYLVGGGGLRRLSVAGDPDAVDSATDPMATFGGGFRTLLSGRWLLLLEARDHLSSYEAAGDGRAQHDLTVSVGVGVRP